MDRVKFFAGLRARDSGVFGTSLSQAQVAGIEAILDAAARHSVTDPHHVANVLAQVYHETGGHRPQQPRQCALNALSGR